MTAHQNGTTKVGIDDMAFYVPGLYLPISVLAEARDIEYAKLNKGLGLTSMAVADTGEDAATMAANAIVDLIRRNGLSPASIGRIYVGTESAVDGSKPTASYVLGMLTDYFREEYGADCFLNCDVVDLTFACIGAVDALQNTLDWVRADTRRIGIVVGADNAKYELGSGGEYTQGAGAVAALVRANPRLMAIRDSWGVATRDVHDFFKPQRQVTKTQLIAEVLRLAGHNPGEAADLLARLPESIEVSGLLDSNEEILTIHKDTPVFDGPYSNDCYQQRIGEALASFRSRAGFNAEAPVTDRWLRLIFHQPYAFQARRMFSEVYVEEARRRGNWEELRKSAGLTEPQAADFPDPEAYRKAYASFLRAVSKTDAYRAFVREKIEKGERASSLVGNLYTASLLLSLMSTLEADLEEGNDLKGKRFGFFAYGSGSKSKVFEGEVQVAWKSVVSRFNLMSTLKDRLAIDYQTYEALHRGRQIHQAGNVQGRFLLRTIEAERENYIGARSYAWVAPVPEQQEVAEAEVPVTSS